MAKTVVTTDDIDGSPNAEEVTFALEGVSYSIDLSKRNKNALEKALKPYVDAAQKTSGRRRRAAATTTRKPARRSSTSDLAGIRAWAVENGYDVSSRGRVAASVIEAYNAAH